MEYKRVKLSWRGLKMLGEGSETEGGKWGLRGRELGAKGEGSGGQGGGKRGLDTPLSNPTYMYIAPRWGQTDPWGPNFFRIINLKSICPFPASFFPINDILTHFPI